MRLSLAGVAQFDSDKRKPVLLAPMDAVVLAWLAVEGPTSRARMAALLWPASSAAQARAALRQRLARMKKILGFDPAGSATSLQLDTRLSHDLADSEDLLGDLRLPDAPELDAWLQAQREQRRSRMRDELRDQARRLEDIGQFEAALSVAQALLRLEPLSELAHRSVMWLHYLCGDRAAALAAFDRCEQVLKDEIGARPGQETLALLATIEAQTAEVGPAASRAVPTSVLRPPRMVGRDREFGQLEQAWAMGSVAAVIGEAGMGKSRLLHEFIQRNPGIARAAGRAGDAGVPFATLARLLRTVSEHSPRAIESLTLEARQDVARVLPELGIVPRHGEGQRARLRRAVAELLLASGSRGLVLDDLHFADAASLQMLQSLIGGEGDEVAATLRWAVAFRRAEAGGPVQQLQQALTETARLAAVPVLPLDVDALVELVDALELPGVPGIALAPMLLQRTGGNPLFVLETLKQAWVERRLDELTAGPLRLRPVSVGQLLEARVAKLSPAALALARVASIAGVDFGIALAERVLDNTAMQFADALNELEAAQVLNGTQFVHDLVFDAVLHSVPEAMAVRVHAQVAAWLEVHEGEPARVAQHWIAATQPGKALPWLERAATRAGFALRTVEQLAFLDQRADIEEALGRPGDAFATRLEALKVFQEGEGSAAAGYARCEALAELARTDEERVRAWLGHSKFASYRKDWKTSEDLSRDALDVAQGCGDPELVRQAQIRLFEALEVDNPREALAHGEACLAWIDDDPDEGLRIEFHAALGSLYDRVGSIAKARVHHEHAIRLARNLNAIQSLAAGANNLAVNSEYSGHLKRALALRLESLQICARLDVAQANPVTRLNLALTSALVGDYAGALHWADDAHRLIREAAPVLLATVAAHRALCWLRLGQTARAMLAIKEIAMQPEALLGARVRRHLLTCWLQRGSGRPHEQHALDGLALLGESDFPHLRELLMIELAIAAPVEQGLEALNKVRERARQKEFGGHVLEAHMRTAQIALKAYPEVAREHALLALELAGEFDLVGSYPAELPLHCARALLTTGQTDRGLQVLAAGVAWVESTARDKVPAEFRASFLQRNPTNRDLLALAAGRVTSA